MYILLDMTVACATVKRFKNEDINISNRRGSMCRPKKMEPDEAGYLS